MANFEIEYGTETVGGNECVVSAVIEARPEEMKMTRGSEERRRRGKKAVVSAAIDVTFVLNTSLYAVRRSAIDVSSVVMAAIPALLMSTWADISIRFQCLRRSSSLNN